MSAKQREWTDRADLASVDEDTVNPLICEALSAAELVPAAAAGLRARLLRRVDESVRRQAGLITVRAGQGSWHAVKAGIAAKSLWQGPHGASLLIEFAAGATLPVHRHHHLEEGIVLRGDLQLGEQALGPGDYHVSPPGSRHGRISSRGGALAYLRGTALGRRGELVGELLAGLLPGDGPPVHTVFASDAGWEGVAEGVEQKILWRDGDVTSRFLRMAPGSRLPGHAHDGDEECMMLASDVFLGDLLLQVGDFHLAPAGSEHGEVHSDNGAVAFVRSRAVRSLWSRS